MNFSIRTQRRLYFACAFVLSLGIAWVAWSGLTALQAAAGSELHIELNTTPTAGNSLEDSTRTTPPGLSLDNFRGPGAGWDRALRGPLYDPAPPPPPAVVPPPPLRLKLLGTVIEPGDRSQAILMTAAGQVEMHRVGAVLQDAAIETIEQDSITVRYHDQLLTLTPEP